MNDQLHLHFPSAAAPLQQDPEVECLVSYLHNNPGFHTAKQLSEILGFTDRQIRKAAELSNGQIVSGPGSPGYCHISHCSLKQLNHIRNTIRSQARQMLNRYLKLGKTAHQTIR